MFEFLALSLIHFLQLYGSFNVCSDPTTIAKRGMYSSESLRSLQLGFYTCCNDSELNVKGACALELYPHFVGLIQESWSDFKNVGLISKMLVWFQKCWSDRIWFFPEEARISCGECLGNWIVTWNIPESELVDTKEGTNSRSQSAVWVSRIENPGISWIENLG